MLVKCYGSEFDIPDLLINKFVKDFEGLPGKGDREGLYELRNSVGDMFDFVAEDPEVLKERIYLSDFVKALAIQQALSKLGILFDA